MTASSATLRLAVLGVVLVGLCPVAGGSVLEVPAAYPTITAAIAAAADGDTVRVAPGTYVENLDLGGKRILVTSHYVAGGDWALVESTVVDGSSPADPAAASTVTFGSGEGPETVLQGFTVTGGRGTLWVDPQFPSYTWRGGGGIFCFQSSPTIRFNLVKSNRVDNAGDVSGAQGGGILCFRGNPLIHNNTITDNEAEYGGGVVVDYSGATLRNNLVSRNTGGRSYGGGGMWTIGSAAAPIVLENNTLADNTSPTRGGALYVWNSTVTVRSSILWGNQQASGDPIQVAGSGQAQVTSSDVEGGFDGDGNLDADPLFADATLYLLSEASPSVDAGDPDPTQQDREDPDHPGQAAWPALGGLRNDMGAYGGPGGQAMGPEPADPAEGWLVPAVTHAPGEAGTQWRTAIACLNLEGSDTVVDVTLAFGGDSVVRRVTLGARSSVEWNDVVVDLFERPATEATSGAVRASATGSILITSRTYNQAPEGTFGQYLPALSAAACLGEGGVGYLLQLKGNDEFRTNVGFANHAGEVDEVRLQLYDPYGVPIGSAVTATVAAGGWTQVNDVFTAAGAGPRDLAYASVEVLSGTALWTYASVVDNATGDATTIPVLVE